MYFTAQFKKSAGALTFNQIILAFALLIVFVGQVSALPAALPGSPLFPGGLDEGHSPIPL